METDEETFKLPEADGYLEWISLSSIYQSNLDFSARELKNLLKTMQQSNTFPLKQEEIE